MFDRAGEMVAMMQVFVRPPNESCRRRVSFDSLCSRQWVYAEQDETKRTCREREGRRRLVR